MAAVFLSAAVVCFAALFLGQGALRLCGAREWSWLAPAIGVSVAMLIAAPTAHIPGRSATVAVVLCLLALAAAVWCLRSPPHRPPLPGLLAALPVALLAAVPFVAAGRGGILGVTVDNDMAAHLIFVESFVSSTAATFNPFPTDYPLGPHAVTAALSTGLDLHADLAFSGLTMALAVSNGWIVQAVVRRGSWFGRIVLATVAGMPFLVAAYYGEGSFKEVAQAGLVLALTLYLSGCGPRLGRGRWVPVALLVGGMISVYSPAGMPWPLVILGLWVAGQLAIAAWRRRLREVPAVVRAELPALGIGVAILLVSLIPQLHRMYEFVFVRGGTGIGVEELGNLVGRLPGWEALGIWDSADFRLPSSPAFSGGPWSLFALALVLFGAYWAFRRGRWLLPVAAAGSLLIWKFSDDSQSPYVTAKALIIASPLLLTLAALPLADPGPERRRWPWFWLLISLLAAVLVLQVGRSDLRALRFSPIGPTDHARQLQSLRAPLEGQRVLYLGTDEFITWELAGASVQPVALATLEELPLRPRKGWDGAQALDWDSLRASTLNEFEWIVAPRDAAASAPPPQLRLVKSTEDYQLWKRVGEVRERSILAEGEWPGAVLDCDTAAGRALLARGGVAAVRPRPVVAPLAEGAPAGGTDSVRLSLTPGRWQLQSPYRSHLPVQVSGPGLRETLPANLEQPGPRLPIGRITVRDRRPVTISFHVEDTALAPPTAGGSFDYVVATPVGAHDRVVPIERACGRYVDWYRPAP